MKDRPYQGLQGGKKLELMEKPNQEKKKKKKSSPLRSNIIINMEAFQKSLKA